MKKIAPLIITLLLGALLGLIYQQNFGAHVNPSTPNTAKPPTAPRIEIEAKNEPEEIKNDLSAQFMSSYGTVETTPQDDIQQISGIIESFLLLVKSPDPLPLGENREITAALIGKNPYRTRLLSPDSPWLNENKELVDRWSTPLYFHPVDAKQIGIRSAGPDQQMWTTDDLINGPNAKPISK